MKALPKSQILRFTEKAIHLARRAVSRYSSKFSKHCYTLPQHAVLICLKVRKNMTDRGLLDELIEMPRVRQALSFAELPTPSTLCKVFNRLDMAVWRDIYSFCGAKGYDAQKIRRLVRQPVVRPLIKHRVFFRSQRCWKQFRELTISCLSHNIDRSL